MFLTLYKRIMFPIPEYVPIRTSHPKDILDVSSAWKGLELIIADITERFNIASDSCLEFGVEFGFSTVALSNYFKKVKGVDVFTGDIHTIHKGDHYQLTQKALEPYKNIELFKIDYKDWIRKDHDHYDLIHVDIVHTYRDTFNCGLWSVEHSTCTIFHDTESFIGVRRAVLNIAKKTGKKVYNYSKCHGLGIVV